MRTDIVQPCPMCGHMVCSKLTTCPGCGERIGFGGAPNEVHAETVRDVDLRTLLNLLGILWIGWSLFRGCYGFYLMADRYSLYVAMSGPSLILMISLGSLAWFVSGLAALQREMWGVYLGYVCSYLMLLANLAYLNLIGMLVAVGFILFSRQVLKQYRQLKEAGSLSDKD